MLVMTLLALQSSAVVLENDYVRVTQDAAPCATATAGCGDRIIVALGPLKVGTRSMTRGDVVVLGPGEKHAEPTGGPYFEVALKPTHPPVQLPATVIPPTGNVTRYDGARFRIFEERLAVGENRPRHSHPQRVVIQLNRTKLKQLVDGQPEAVVRDIEPDRPTFNAPVVHTSENVGDKPLRGIVIELK